MNGLQVYLDDEDVTDRVRDLSWSVDWKRGFQFESIDFGPGFDLRGPHHLVVKTTDGAVIAEQKWGEAK
jgi:hypothetical protein